MLDEVEAANQTAEDRYGERRAKRETSARDRRDASPGDPIGSTRGKSVYVQEHDQREHNEQQAEQVGRSKVDKPASVAVRGRPVIPSQTEQARQGGVSSGLASRHFGPPELASLRTSFLRTHCSCHAALFFPPSSTCPSSSSFSYIQSSVSGPSSYVSGVGPPPDSGSGSKPCRTQNRVERPKQRQPRSEEEDKSLGTEEVRRTYDLTGVAHWPHETRSEVDRRRVTSEGAR